MPEVKTSDLRDWHIKEKPKPGKKAKPVISRDLTNKQIDKARDQENESDETETKTE